MAATHSSASPVPAGLAYPRGIASVESRLTKQFLQEAGSSDSSPSSNNESMLSEPRASPKSRSLSDAARPALAPSPLSQDLRPISKDDISLVSNPATPQKQHSPVKGLFLQMPPKRAPSPTSTSFDNSVPLSPKLDSSQTYGSPASVLPRRSRGLDFSRACTNLHHSTLAEASPDTSPTIGGRGMPIPPRKANFAQQGWDSPGNTFNQPWSTSGNNDRVAISSSVSSVNMLDSDTSSSEDEDDTFPMGDREDPVLTTPQVNRGRNGLSNPFSTGTMHSPGGEWRGNYSPAVASLMSFRRTRTRSGRNRHNMSISASNPRPSPGPLSPSVIKSIESSNSGYFTKDSNDHQLKRDSTNSGSNDINLSDISDEGDSRVPQASSPLSSSLGSTANPEARGVIRRPVTRRGNLLVRNPPNPPSPRILPLYSTPCSPPFEQPKTKTFARIRAALFEEGAPVDSEAKLEAEVIRQVRESDSGPNAPPPSLQPSVPPTSSAANPDAPTNGPSGKPTIDSFKRQAVQNSAGAEFWDTFDERHQTPPPSKNSSSLSEDTIMDTPPSSIHTQETRKNPWNWDSAAAGRLSRPSIITDTSRKAHKRMRDEDFDPNSFKRRAVSPSVQSSPILPQSPAMKDPNQWNRSSKPTSSTERPHGNDNGAGVGQPGSVKRVGLQGMNETNDGLMNMSIE
ncbi:hypothetical protein FQN54_001411 [Arachnomyces sp. PD_36]|nr:hypothetical protein FQN54_001411 [Arachnomyces sp. PD_36]